MPETDLYLYYDTLTLSGDRSILLSNFNKPRDLSKLKTPESLETDDSLSSHISQFGLFGGGNNYHTFYPDVTKEDIEPSEDEFIQPVFRMLSACIVSKNWFPTEFPEDVLRNSMNLLLGQTVNCDHSTDIANAIGSVLSVEWQNSYKLGGIKIPAGINAVLKIDAKSNPRIARGIMMDPPSIHSNSVTVQFEWKPSHEIGSEDLPDMYAFYDKLGQYDANGNMYRRIATKIISYKETSLVSHGADPFAQKLVNGKIVNPVYADKVYNSYKEYSPEDQKYLRSIGIVDYRDPNTTYSFVDTVKNSENHDTDINLNINNQNEESMKELEKFLESLVAEGMLSLGEGVTLSSEAVFNAVKDLISEKNTISENLSQKEAEITSLKEKVSNLETTVASNSSFVEMGKNHLSEVRSNTLASYKKLMGDKADSAIITLIEAETTNLETLVSLKKSYEDQLNEKFPMTCSECGSHNITRGSSIIENNDDHGNEGTKLSTEESIRNIRERKYKEYIENHK